MNQSKLKNKKHISFKQQITPSFLAWSLATLALTTPLTINSAFAASESRWYSKIDIGYGATANNITHTIQNTAGKSVEVPMIAKARGPLWGFGLGYSFNDRARADITLFSKAGFNATGSATATWKNSAGTEQYTVPNTEKSSVNSYGATFNLAYELIPLEDVVPFITAGIGAESLSEKWSLDGTGTVTINNAVAPNLQAMIGFTDLKSDNTPNLTSFNKSPIQSKRKVGVTGFGGVGLTFKSSDKINLDLTYKLGLYNSLNYDFKFAEVAVRRNTSTTPPTDTWQVDAPNTQLANSAQLKRNLQHSVSVTLRLMM